MIYLDNAATTRVRTEAAQAAMNAMVEEFGNPSSLYPLGQSAKVRREASRASVAKALGCRSDELIFTSCGTEGDNWAVRAAADLGRRKGKHIITTAIEHSAVLEPCKALEREGYEVTCLPPEAGGTVSVQRLEEALRPDTILVSMMLVNNELGTVLPVREAAQAIRRAGAPALLHTDAVQGFLKLDFTVKDLGVDLLTISGHKIGAPKGIGALYIRNELRGKLKPLLLGGGQENGLRPGTEPTAQIAALGAACELGLAEREANMARMAALKEYAVDTLLRRVPELELVGNGTAPHILCLTLPGYKSEVLVRMLGGQGICISAGSACHRGKPSHVFAALPLSKAQRNGAFRVSFSHESSKAEVDALAGALAQARDTLFPSMS
ncbi:MAG: cysteine desulfurase [Oscillospiraceae bacterium]|nr:cysteine desulfurase [Oscillospiraceae bacterium]